MRVVGPEVLRYENNHEADEKALDAGTVPKKYGALLEKAKDAVQTLLKQGGALIKVDALKEKVPKLKEGYKILAKHMGNLENVLTLEDLPDGKAMTKQNMDSFIETIATDVDTWNGEMQSYQGFLKAKK